MPIDRDSLADRSAQLREVNQKHRRSIVAYKPIDREPRFLRAAQAPIDCQLLADRSARPPEEVRRRFPRAKGSEIPPKLGQTLCSINRTQFGRRKGTWTKKKDFSH